MSYPERKPIYEAYEAIVKEIVRSNQFEVYAEAEIEALDRALLAAFREIRLKHVSLPGVYDRTFNSSAASKPSHQS